MMLRDATELRQPLAKETVAVLAGVCVSITDDVGVGVGGRPIVIQESYEACVRQRSHA